MKLKRIAIASMAVLALAACNKKQDVNPEGPKNGTYAQITFKESLRADPSEGQNNAPGTEGETKVARAIFLTEDASNTDAMSTEVSPFTPGAGEEEKSYQSDAFLYAGATGPNVKTALVVNGFPLSGADLRADYPIALKKGDTTMAKYTKASEFIMSTPSNIEQDIKADVAKDAVADGNNRFTYTVERVAAKLQVTQPTGGFTVNEMSAANDNTIKYVGDFSDVRYALAGGAMKSYLFADKAGKRELSQANASEPFKYEGFKSIIDGNVGTTGTGANITWRKDIQKVSDLVLHTHSADTKFATLNSLPLNKQASADDLKKSLDADGIFFFENSLSGAIMMHDIAHAKIYANFTPKTGMTVYKVNAAKDGVEAGGDLTVERSDEVAVTKEWVAGLKAEKKTELTQAGTLTGNDTDGWKLKMTIAKGSFFVGKTTGKVYETLSAARLDGNKKSQLYKGGRMFWEVPANKQMVENKVYADTRRNNIYSLEVKSISGLGDNWDNSDPDDPNIPKPNPEDNPDEPDKPTPTPIIPKYNHIQVAVKILQWNLVHRGLDLK